MRETLAAKQSNSIGCHAASNQQVHTHFYICSDCLVNQTSWTLLPPAGKPVENVSILKLFVGRLTEAGSAQRKLASMQLLPEGWRELQACLRLP